MKSKNFYSYPVEKKNIKKIITFGSPAHRKYFNEERNANFDLTHAVDFLCDEGTPIKVALDGKVISTQDGMTKNWDKHEIPPADFMKGYEQNGNFVVLKHKNHEFSIYCHLQVGKIAVKLDDDVKTEDILGYSGHTGWSISPHLHFMVFKFTKPEPAKDFESLEIQWKQL